MKFLIAAPPTPNNFLVSFMKTLGVLWEVRVRVCAVLQPVGLLALRWLVTKNLLTKLKGKIPWATLGLKSNFVQRSPSNSFVCSSYLYFTPPLSLSLSLSSIFSFLFVGCWLCVCVAGGLSQIGGCVGLITDLSQADNSACLSSASLQVSPGSQRINLTLSTKAFIISLFITRLPYLDT